MTVKGRLLRFISNFMSNRSFRVLIGDTLSEKYQQKNGVVQGAVLSVNLFLVAMVDITKDIRSPVKIVGYADDWTIYMRGWDIDSIQQELQNTVDKLGQWAQTRGFRFSTSKTVTMHFTRLRPRTYVLLTITLHGQVLQKVNQHKILRLIFDEKFE
jgi:Reverse transcriptase (RNA-dependent DNA polymerase)